MAWADLKWAALGLLAVAAAVAVLVVGAVSAPAVPVDARGMGSAAVASVAASRAASVDVRGAEGVPALAGDGGGFAEAFAAYLGAGEGDVVTVAANPDDAGGKSFFAHAGGLWYACERVGGASEWAFALIGEESPVAVGAAGEHAPGQGADVPAAEQESNGAQGGVREEWILLSDAGALGAAVGSETAALLPDAMAGYAAAKGVGFDPASARVDASSVRGEPGGVGFVADTGSVRVDVVYAGGAFGFLVL